MCYRPMNVYSKWLVIAGLIAWGSAEFVHSAMVYVAFVLIMLAFFLPFIVTKVTGTQFKGN